MPLKASMWRKRSRVEKARSARICAPDGVSHLFGQLETVRIDHVGRLRELTFAGELAQGWQDWSGYSWLEARITSSPALDNTDKVTMREPIQGRSAASW